MHPESHRIFQSCIKSLLRMPQRALDALITYQHANILSTRISDLSLNPPRGTRGISAAGNRHVSAGPAGHGNRFQRISIGNTNGFGHVHTRPCGRAIVFQAAQRQIRPQKSVGRRSRRLHRLHDSLHILAGHRMVQPVPLLPWPRRSGRRGAVALSGNRLLLGARTRQDSGHNRRNQRHSARHGARDRRPVRTRDRLEGIICILLGIGLVLLGAYIPFRESHPVEKRHKGSLGSLMGQATLLLRNRLYLNYVYACSSRCSAQA